jgi:hypothetical protein
MANPLTGDFDAVLQVSGSTINRLLASMHQNTGLDTKLPTFPHSVAMRIGDPTPIEGLRGTAWAQLSVPRIDLIHGEDDRFNLEVAIRARYKPDPGTTPLPEFIHGTVRAQYRIDNIDPNCWGWGKAAADYLWIRVVGGSVSFDGTAVDETSPFTVLQPTDAAANDARITRLIWYLLKYKFEATPQKVEQRFRRGSMRSLNVGVNRSVVAVALAGQGQLSSVNQDLLEGRDFGVAVSSEFIVSSIQRELDAMKAAYSSTYGITFKLNADFGLFDVDVLTVNVTWRITIGLATVQWSGGTLPMFGGTSVGVLTIRVVGHARTKDAKFNTDCDLTQMVMLSFNGATEEFVAALIGTPTLNLTGLPGLLVGAGDKQKIAAHFKPTIEAEVNKLVGHLSVKNRKDDLINQLKKLDTNPDAHFDEAVFSPDGVVVRGYISLAARRPALSAFVKTAEQDGFNAFESWIPGGRIDSFDWSWSWFNNANAPGTAKVGDRFLLRRPVGLHRSNFGMVKDLSRPLPILDGWGVLCLTIRGVRVDPVTGALVAVTIRRKCLRAGFDVRVQGVAGGRVFLKEWAKSKPDPIGPVEEVSLIDVGGGRSDRAPNTLVIRSGERWDRETGAALRDALLSSRRLDAGLQILMLFPDGTLAARGNIVDDVMQFAADLEAPLVVNEDVRGTWSAALAMDPSQGDVQWRLVTPTGGVSWAHTGTIEPPELARVFDNYLFPSPPPSPRTLVTRVVPGTRLDTSVLGAGLYYDVARLEAEERCPPPLGPYSYDARAVFVQADSRSSRAAIERLAREYSAHEGDRPFVALIVDGASPEDLDRLKERLPEEFVAIPDPRGAIASQFGIRAWPTSVTVTEGIVTAVDVGAEPVSRTSDSESAS